MKIHINQFGLLEIERAGKQKEQTCPFAYPDQYRNTYDQPYTERVSCGDWCPLFGELTDLSDAYHDLGQTLTICQGRILSGEIINERPKV